MDRIAVAMIRRNLDDIPHLPLPAGYHFRTFRRGDESLWAEVQTAAGLFESTDKALERFAGEFAPHIEEMESRCFFIISEETGEAVGAGVAWHDADFQGEGDYGRLHWVAMRPEYQGRGLGKPLVSLLMERLAETHERAYLWTNHTCARAIYIYLDFGFEPMLISDRAEEAWRLLADELKHPALSAFAG